MSSADASARKPAVRLLRLPEVCKATGLGRAMIYRLQAQGRFPRAVRITDFAVGWVEHEVQAWLNERIERHRSLPGSRVVRIPGQHRRGHKYGR